MGWHYAAATAAPDVARLRSSYRMFVDGKFVDGAGGARSVLNPATADGLTTVSTATHTDVDAAVRAARRAYDKVWSRMPGTERARYLFRIARLVQERGRELAVVHSLESGTPITQSRDVDLPAMAAHFFYHAGWADKLGYAGYGADPRPMGVAGAILPSDSAQVAPRIAASAIAPALACGNTVVVKPGQSTPLTTLALAELCRQADLPPGVLNVLPGGPEPGAALAGHSGVDVVVFSGSVEVGKQVQRIVAGTGRRLSLALGGTATTVVFDDAPLDQATEGIVTAAFTGAATGGPGTRLLVQESISEQLLAALLGRAAGLRTGDPLDENTDVGAIGSRDRLQRIRELAEGAEADGARRWTSPAPLPDRGYFFAPTVFSEVGQAMRIAGEQIVGPVLPVLTFRTPDEAVAKANNAAARVSASIWTDKGSTALWAAQQLRVGTVWANTVHLFDPTAPFGGNRESGWSRAGGRAGLEAYLDA
jgi:aldehyde dehydrogenase (NAD+)